MTIDDLQALIEKMYSHKDRARGTPITFMWMMEEIGELSPALRGGSKTDTGAALAAALAWPVPLVNTHALNLTDALKQKYGEGCPGCGLLVCTCETKI